MPQKGILETDNKALYSKTPLVLYTDLRDYKSKNYEIWHMVFYAGQKIRKVRKHSAQTGRSLEL